LEIKTRSTENAESYKTLQALCVLTLLKAKLDAKFIVFQDIQQETKINGKTVPNTTCSPMKVFWHSMIGFEQIYFGDVSGDFREEAYNTYISTFLKAYWAINLS